MLAATRAAAPYPAGRLTPTLHWMRWTPSCVDDGATTGTIKCQPFDLDAIGCPVACNPELPTMGLPVSLFEAQIMPCIS